MLSTVYEQRERTTAVRVRCCARAVRLVLVSTIVTRRPTIVSSNYAVAARVAVVVTFYCPISTLDLLYVTAVSSRDIYRRTGGRGRVAVHAQGWAQLNSSGYEYRRALLCVPLSMNDEVNTYTCESLLAKIEDQLGWTTTDSDSPSYAEHRWDTLETKYATTLWVGCFLQENTRHQASYLLLS